MDTIITLIIVIITIVSAFTRLKAKQKAAKGAKPVKSGELATKLKAFFTEIQERFEAQTQKGTSGAPHWGRLMQGDDANGSSADHYDMSLEDLVLEDEELPAEPEKKPPARSTRFETQPSKKMPAGRPPGLGVPEPVPVKTAWDRAFMRRAVIWSEILGPPVALRDFPGDR